MSTENKMRIKKTKKSDYYNVWSAILNWQVIPDNMYETLCLFFTKKATDYSFEILIEYINEYFINYLSNRDHSHSKHMTEYQMAVKFLRLFIQPKYNRSQLWHKINKKFHKKKFKKCLKELPMMATGFMSLKLAKSGNLEDFYKWIDSE